MTIRDRAQTKLTQVATLFVSPASFYKSMQSVDCWDIGRDARQWPGGSPLIAHPPCRAWGQLHHMAKPREGRTGTHTARALRLAGRACPAVQDMTATGAHGGWPDAHKNRAPSHRAFVLRIKPRMKPRVLTLRASIPAPRSKAADRRKPTDEQLTPNRLIVETPPTNSQHQTTPPMRPAPYRGTALQPVGRAT